jgi:hypothetical protein
VPAPTATTDRAVETAALPPLEAAALPQRIELGTDPASWRWVRWMLAGTLLACLAVAAFNVAIDPSGQLGTGVLDQTTRLTRDRAAKVELLQRATDPGVVVLGTSRAKQIDPSDLDASAREPINAAAVGGDLFEPRVFAVWMAKRADESSFRFPHLVLGVDIEGFRGRSLHGSGLLGVAPVRSVARREAGEPSWLELLPDASQLLLTLDTTRASYRTMRVKLRQRSAVQAKLHGEDRTRSLADFTAEGLPKETRDWLDPTKVAALAHHTHLAIQPSIERYRSNYVDRGPVLDPASIEDLQRLIAVAVQHGDHPLVFITPANAQFAAALDPAGRAARHARVAGLLRRLARSGDIRWIDCSTCVPSKDELWIDGVHTSPLGARVLARALRRADR